MKYKIQMHGHGTGDTSNRGRRNSSVKICHSSVSNVRGLSAENAMSIYTEQDCDNDELHITEATAVQALMQLRTNYDLTIQSETENTE